MADEQAREDVDQDESQNGGGDRSRLAGLTSKEILFPVAATAAAAAAAGLAAKKGPDLMKVLGGEANEEAEKLGRKGAEGAKQQLSSGGGIAGKAASKLLGGGGGGGGGGQSGGKTRRLPIQRWTDVAVPVEQAYKAWTKFEEFPKFMHRVLDVDQEDGNKIHWREKIWFSTREWDGEITEKRPNDRIAWKSVSGTQHSGVISFHRLDKNLTRVLVTLDFVPSGMIEKMASGLRFVKRAVEADLARFKAYVEFGDAKGLEYRSQPEEMEQHRDGDGDGDGENEEKPQSQGESHGGGEKESSDSDDRDRDAERRERENRRHERREALTSN